MGRRRGLVVASGLVLVGALVGGVLAAGHTPERTTPRDEVVYGVVPGLWQGPDESAAEAVRRELPRIADLGATIVWLWPPVHERAEGEEYAITDFTALDPQWGEPAELTALVDDAHALGLRVIVDVVLNHTSDQHPWFLDAAAPASPTWDHYERVEGAATHYFDWDHLPNLDVDRPEVRDHLVDALLTLIRVHGVDGFRLDAAWGPARRTESFWPDVVERVRAEAPEAFLLVEADVDDAWLAGLDVDAAYDWGEELGEWAWTDVWQHDEPAAALARTLGDEARDERPATLRFLDTNDTGARFVETAGPELARVAAVVEMTTPGIPLVFAGQESALGYEPYEVQAAGSAAVEGQRADPGLSDLYRDLIDLRCEVPALRSASLGRVDVQGDVLVLRRPSVGGVAAVTVANLGTRAAEVTVDLGSARALLRTSPDVDVTTTPAGARVRLPGRTAAVLTGG